ncbi:MAG: VWA domain-containing protein [Vicinamibacteria bacterium]
MRRAVWTLGLVLLVASGAPAQAPPVFKAEVDLVRVDVAVTRGGVPVADLRPRDFEIREDGRLQNVDGLLEERDLPLDVSLVLDASTSVRGERLLALREGALAFVDGLRPADRAAVICFSEQVSLRAAAGEPVERIRRAIETVEGNGSTALRDALWSALALREVPSATRGVVVAFSDGVDNMSWLSEAQLLDTARRTDSVVYGVIAAPARGQAGTNERFLDALASATGGRTWRLTEGRPLRSVFVEVLAHIRSRYVLSYVPGVDRPGWHALEVRLRGPRASVLARPGYQR